MVDRTFTVACNHSLANGMLAELDNMQQQWGTENLHWREVPCAPMVLEVCVTARAGYHADHCFAYLSGMQQGALVVGAMR